MKHLLALTAAIAIAVSGSIVSGRVALAVGAHFVYHQADHSQIAPPPGITSSGNNCSNNTLPDYQQHTNIHGQVDAYWKVEYQGYTTNGTLFYTTDGSTPSGFHGTPTPGSTTQAIAATFDCLMFQNGTPNVDIWHAVIPAPAGAATVNYIIEAYNPSDDCTVWANTGSCVLITSPDPTVFSYQATPSPTLAAVSRLTIHRSGSRTTLRWYSAQHVLGFNVYGGKARLNHRLVTSRTRWYTFTYPRPILHLRIVAIDPGGAIKS